MPPNSTDGPSGADRHLETAHLQGDLIGRSVRGGAVTVFAQALKVVIQFAAIVVLARLLSPDDFGLFAMIAAFLAVLELLKDMGLSMATVQRTDITHRQVSTLFWLNCLFGVVIAVVTAAMAPLFVWFYGEPALMEITPVVALAFLFTGLAAQHLALMRRQMRFTVLAGIQLASEAGGLAAAVLAAWAGFGVWALVVQRIVWAVILAVGGWVACDWRPSRPGPWHEVRSLAAFGGNATGAMVIGALTGNLDKVLIGWYWGVASLGLFERAQKLINQPIQNLNGPLASVALPALSRMTEHPESYHRFYTGLVLRLTMFVAPASAVIIAAAEPVTVLVLGERWIGAAPIIGWLGVSVVAMPVTYSLSWLYMSQDRTPEMLRTGILNGLIGVLALLAGLPFGVVGVAIAYAAAQFFVRGPILFWLAGRRGPVKVIDFYRVLAVPATAAFSGAAAVWAARSYTPVDSLPIAAAIAWYCVISIVAALAVYAGLPGSRRVLGEVLRLPGRCYRKVVRT